MPLLTKEELLHNMELTLTVVEQMEKVDQRVRAIQRKPIRGSFIAHFAIVSLTTALIGTLFLLKEFGFSALHWLSITRANLLYFLAVPLVGYPSLLYVINLYVYLSKRWLYRDELKKLELRRIGLVEKLHSHSYIPEDYWTVDKLQRMKKFLLNQRADTLKEVLNLLEEELRYEQLMSSFGFRLPWR